MRSIILKWLQGGISRRARGNSSFSKDQGRNAASYESAPTIIDPAPADSDEAEYREHDRRYKNAQTTTNIFIALFTAVTAGVGIWQGIQTRQALTSADRQTRAAEDSNKIARESIASNLQQNREILKVSALQTKESIEGAAEANRKTLNASVQQSQTALDATITNFHQEQRAWLSIINLQVITEPSGGHDLAISYDISNSGRTPALQVSSKNQLSITEAETSSPDWRSVSPRNASVVFPETKITQNFTHEVESPISVAYIAKSLRIHIRTRVDYQDVFGNSHWTETCSVHAWGESSGQFIACIDGGSVDVDDRRNRLRKSHTK